MDPETTPSRFSRPVLRPSRSLSARTSSFQQQTCILDHRARPENRRSNSCRQTFISNSSRDRWDIPYPSARAPDHALQHGLLPNRASGGADIAPSQSQGRRGTLASSDKSVRPPVRSKTTSDPRRRSKMKRWALDETSEWDELRKDPDLWFDDGDCYVHTYARGQSRRGPSFCVPFDDLRRYNTGAMFTLCFAQQSPRKRNSSDSADMPTDDYTSPENRLGDVDLFIPVPDGVSKEESYRYHVTTRNFIALVFDRPLVGDHLGQALVDLLERMNLYRTSGRDKVDNHKDLLDYVTRQGYRDFTDQPDYALAMLYFSEHFKLRDLWVDAFAHCVGMNERLSLSAEFEPNSILTKSLITRAYLDMDIQLGRVMVALSSFLEHDLSPSFLGISSGSRAHLDRFKSFLHSFYVEKFGYWPPPRGVPFSKSIYQSMHFDFQRLYDYLVDTESDTDLSTQKPASGGICVFQNVEMFDKRHGFPPLQHPLPLLPQDQPRTKSLQSQKKLRTLTLGSKQAKTDRHMTTRAALSAATNTRDFETTNCDIVKAFTQFEKQAAIRQREEKISTSDARKIRWLVIYGTLQYLNSAVRAPAEVRNPDLATYPLCCSPPQQMLWQQESKKKPEVPAVSSYSGRLLEDDYFGETPLVPELSPLNVQIPRTYSIQPDCQSEHYLTYTNSHATVADIPAPLRVRSPLARNISPNLSFKRLSRSARSSRRNSVDAKSLVQPFRDIYIHGYGNGLNEAVMQSTTPELLRSDTVGTSSSLGLSDNFPLTSTPSDLVRRESYESSIEGSPTPRGRSMQPDTNKTPRGERSPCFESYHMDQLINTDNTEEPSSATSSAKSMLWSEMASPVSSKSSIYCGTYDHKDSSAEASGLLGGLVSIDNTPISSPRTSRRNSRLLLGSRNSSPAPSIQRHQFRFSFSNHGPPVENLSSLPDSSSHPDNDPNIGLAICNMPEKNSEKVLDSHPAPSRTYTIPLAAPLPKPRSRASSSQSFLGHTFSKQDAKPKIPSTNYETLSQSPGVDSFRRMSGAVDIFSALSTSDKEGPTCSARLKKTAIPERHDSKLMQSPKSRTPEIDMRAVVAKASKDRKKDRLSFWRRATLA